MLLSQIPHSYRIKFSDADFKESEHPRGNKENPGQFAKKGAGGTKKVASRNNADLQKAFKEKTHVSGPVKALSDGHTREEALKKAKALRAKGISANVWHQSGPKTGPKSQYFISVPMDKEEGEKKKGKDKLFHGTSARILKKVLSEGLRPQSKKHFDGGHYTGIRKDSVFVAKDFKKALKFADHCTKGRASLPVVFKVRANAKTLQNDVWNPGCKMKKGGFAPEEIISYSLDRGKTWQKPKEAPYRDSVEEYYTGFAISSEEAKELNS
jgi:hypothetical protein